MNASLTEVKKLQLDLQEFQKWYETNIYIKKI